MTQAQIIEAVLQAPPDRLDAIMKAVRGAEKPRPGTIKQAAAILECCPATVTRYVNRGLLHPARITQRRVRYDLNEVELLAGRGAVGV
jgi:hypothetical protein